jgi:hypothetical protein
VMPGPIVSRSRKTIFMAGASGYCLDPAWRDPALCCSDDEVGARLTPLPCLE